MPRVFPHKQFLFASILVAVLTVLLNLPAAAQRNAELSRLVVVGDSLSAGYQNGSLLGTQQVNGYANLVAKQANTPLVLPLIADPGVPPVLQLVSVNPLVIQPSTETIPQNPRINSAQQATDLAVPGANVADVLTKVPFAETSNDYVLTNLVLGLPGALMVPPVLKTQVQWAQALQPTTVLLWIGNNDALGAATKGSAKVTPVWDFAASYGKVVDELAKTHARLVIANIPDVTAIPYFFSVPKLATMFGVPKLVIMARLKLRPGDFVLFGSLSKAAAILQTGAGTLSDSDVLTAVEAAKVSAAIDAYNFIIRWNAWRVGAMLVDINGLFKRVGRRGYFVNGRVLTTDFLGGIFSLDGIHPTNTGYAIVANEFITDMNRSLDTDIPLVSVSQIAATDPLVLTAVGHAANALKQGDLDGMKAVLGH